MKAKIIKAILIVIILLVILLLYPIGKLILTDTKVTKSLFTDEYYVEISSDEYDFNVFNAYMENKGWKENKSKRLGGLYVFEKDSKEKEILNTNIKTISIDGELNF